MQSAVSDAQAQVEAIRPMVPTLMADRDLVRHWLKTARRAQLVLVAAVLIGFFVFPVLRDSMLGLVLPAKEERSGFLGLNRKKAPHVLHAPLSFGLTTIYWVGSLGGAGWLLWLHIPVVLAGAGARDSKNGAAGGVLASSGGGASTPTAAGGSMENAAHAATMYAGQNAQPAAPKLSDVASAPTMFAQTEPPPAMPEAPGESGSLKPGGRYDIDEEIGRGGMGIVFRATDTVLGRVVALKELPLELRRSPELAERFRQEARVVAQLSHPHIVSIFDLVEDAQGMWMAMELMQGGSLSDQIQDEGAMPLETIVAFGTRMAEALGHAHARGVVHRDFKPDNVLLSDEGVPKVADFGLAKLVQQSPNLTQAGSVMGSPAYMSPEQASGREVDHRTDIYALGVTLFEMATGRVPFEGDTGSVLVQHITQAPPSPRSLSAELPEALDALLLEMLAKSPDERVSDMAQVITRLSALQAASA